MGQERRIDTMNWAKIHKSTKKNNRGGHLPNMGKVGPAPGSAELGGSAEPPVAPMDAGFVWTAGIDPQWRLEGITDHSNHHNHHSSAIKGLHLLTSLTHLKQ